MDFDQISPKSMEFLAKIHDSPKEQLKEQILQFIATMESRNVIVPEFKESFDWLNTNEKLKFGTHLSKKLCVLDFFTYCCINCMHVLPDLHALENKFTIQDGLSVIGVHSAKFQNEKILTNVLNAVLRYDITHPVVSDPDAVLWNGMSIRCWPTFVVVSPEGKVLLYLVGEGHREILFQFIEVALDYYKGKGLISDHALPIQLAKETLNKDLLLYPGKLAVSPCGNQIAVADTGHHSILILTKQGLVQNRIGCGEAGLKDGSYTECCFNAPQGLCWHGDNIYVADTENHVIRKIDVKQCQVSTIVGTGCQGNDKEGGKLGLEQEISSPWDVLIGPSPGSDASSDQESCLYIAVTGTHQIWSYYLKDGSWLKKGSQTRDTCLRFAGNGNEENRNNSYPHKAAFAQPSHLTMAIVKEQQLIVIADSESSSVRTLDIKTGAVKACVGGERDPTNLFAYGDVDGKGVNAKLQHPLAVAYNKNNQKVYVADSYNHKIKVIDPVSLTITTIAGTGKAGFKDGLTTDAEFNEPGGLSFDPTYERLYVTDTNNHKIRVLDINNNIVSTLNVLEQDEIDASPVKKDENVETVTVYKPLFTSCKNITDLPAVTNNLASGLEVHLQLDLGSLHFTEDVQSKWQLVVMDTNSTYLSHLIGDVDKESCVVASKISPMTSDILLKVELLLYVCTKDNTCLMKSYLFNRRVRHDKKASSGTMVISQHINV